MDGDHGEAQTLAEPANIDAPVCARTNSERRGWSLDIKACRPGTQCPNIEHVVVVRHLHSDSTMQEIPHVTMSLTLTVRIRPETKGMLLLTAVPANTKLPMARLSSHEKSMTGNPGWGSRISHFSS